MVEIIPKPPEKKFPISEILFYFALALLLAAVLGIFVLDTLQKRGNLTLEILEKDLAAGRGSQEITLEEEVLNYQKKIADFSYLLDNRRNVSNFFGFFEKLSHPKIWFSSFSFTSQNASVKLVGQTDSFQTLGQQIIILRKKEEIKNINLSNVRIEKEGKIEFELNFSLAPKIFKTSQ